MVDQGVVRRLLRCARGLERISGRCLAPLRLGSGRARLLLGILDNPGVTQDQLSHHAGVDKTTTAKSVRRLESAGYVERRREGSDLRARHLYATETAGDLRADLEKRLREIRLVLLQGFLDSEIDRLSGYLSRMLDNLERHESIPSNAVPRVPSPTRWD